MKLLISKHNEFEKHLAHSTRVLLSLALYMVLMAFGSNNASAQNEKTYHSFLNSSYTSGHISAHTEKISHAIRGFTHGVDIISSNLLPVKTKMGDRQKLVYLDIGLHYIKYPMDYLGESFALTFGRSGRIFQLNKFQLHGQIMQGIGFCTEPYTQLNNKNNAISTNVGFHIHANLTATYPIYKNWYALFALGYSHLSNAAIKKPNLGYNVMSTNFGVAYHIKDKTINDTFDYYKDSRKYYYHAIGSYFPTTSRSFSGEKFPSYSFHLQGERNISLHHSLLLSLDYFNNKEVRYPTVDKPEDASNNENSYFGISIGGNWKYSIVDFNVTTGYYLIHPWDVGRKHYTLAHFKIYALKNKYIVAGLKAHGFAAISFEAGLGIKI